MLHFEVELEVAYELSTLCIHDYLFWCLGTKSNHDGQGVATILEVGMHFMFLADLISS